MYKKPTKKRVVVLGTVVLVVLFCGYQTVRTLVSLWKKVHLSLCESTGVSPYSLQYEHVYSSTLKNTVNEFIAKASVTLPKENFKIETLCIMLKDSFPFIKDVQGFYVNKK